MNECSSDHTQQTYMMPYPLSYTPAHAMQHRRFTAKSSRLCEKSREKFGKVAVAFSKYREAHGKLTDSDTRKSGIKESNGAPALFIYDHIVMKKEKKMAKLEKN